MCKIFVIPWGIAKFKWSPSPFIIKTSELASVFEAEIDYPLGWLQVKAGNLRGILMVVCVKLEKKRQKSNRINNLYATDKKFSWRLPIVPHC